jgi:DNA invertase Pin-like site-specific DNA recombinase
MKIGYARVSTEDQNLRLQQEALQKAGCQKIYQEKVSGAQVKRRALEELLNNIRPGDRLVVCKLDRLGRSLKELVKIIEVLQEKQIAFESIQQSINTRTALGRYFFHTFSTLAV